MPNDYGIVHVYRDGHMYSAICRAFASYRSGVFSQFSGGANLTAACRARWLWLITHEAAKIVFLRAAINAVGMFCGFTALTLIPLAQMTALSFTTPLFVTIGAVLFLGEVIRARRIAVICVGFLGTLIILQPGVVDITSDTLLALISALTIAMASLIVKTLTLSESQHAIVTWMVVMQAPLALIPSLWFWQWPDLLTWGFLWCMALAGTIAHLCFTRAFSLVDITALQPLEFIKLPFSVILAWIIFTEWPGLWTFVGGAVILTSTVYITTGKPLRASPCNQLLAHANHGCKLINSGPIC
ncbi:DMT family transporter [Alphaproteobacteria bacterium]|nr:DMT family transporter [Alphaproteobacteria bacterium]